MKRSLNLQRGDTLIEVMIAIVILSVVVVGAQHMLNVGQDVAIEDVQRTEVQASVESQLNDIRYMRDEFIRADKQLTTPGAVDWGALTGTPGQYLVADAINSDACGGGVRNAFWLSDDLDDPSPDNQVQVHDASVTSSTDIPQPGNGIWVEAQQPLGATYVDFVAKACWSSIEDGPQQQVKSTMRLLLP